MGETFKRQNILYLKLGGINKETQQCEPPPCSSHTKQRQAKERRQAKAVIIDIEEVELAQNFH